MATIGDLDQWQCGKSLPECLGFMFENEIACDVTFIVGEKKVETKAHKTILISRSPVFYAMFNGLLRETDTITVPDIEDDVLKQVFRYVYTDNTTLTEETVIPILYAAKKYCLDGLSQQCVEFLEYAITEENVFILYEQAQMFGEQELEEKCWGKIKRNPNCLHSPSFLDLGQSCLEKIVSSDDLPVKEESIYERVLEWSEAECSRQQLEVSGVNKRQVLGSILHEIRFPIFDTEYFSQHLLNSDLLESGEKEVLTKLNINADVERSTCLFKCKKRNYFVKEFEEKVIRFRRVYRGTWKYNSSTPDKINFSISKPAVLHGVLLYGDDSKSTFRVDLTILDDQDTVLSIVKTNYTAAGPDHMSDIILETPVSVVANRHYKIIALILGPISKAGDEGMKQIFLNDIKISFFKENVDNNGTNIRFGQIPGLLVSF